MKRSIMLMASLMVVNAFANVNDDFLALWPATPEIDITSEAFLKDQDALLKTMQDFLETVVIDNLTKHDAAMQLYVAAVCQVAQEAQKIEGTSKKSIAISKVLTQVDKSLIRLNDADIVALVQTSSFGMEGAYQRYLAAWAVLMRDLDDAPVSGATRTIVTQSIKPLPYDVIAALRANNDPVSTMFYSILEVILFEKAEMKKMGMSLNQLDKELFEEIVPAKAADVMKRILPKECAQSLNFNLLYVGLSRRLLLEDATSATAVTQLSNYCTLLQRKIATITDKKAATNAGFIANKMVMLLVLDAIGLEQIAQKAQPAQ